MEEKKENAAPECRKNSDLHTFLIALLTAIIVVALYHFGSGLCKIYCPGSCGGYYPTPRYMLVPVMEAPMPGMGMPEEGFRRGPRSKFGMRHHGFRDGGMRPGWKHGHGFKGKHHDGQFGHKGFKGKHHDCQFDHKGFKGPGVPEENAPEAAPVPEAKPAPAAKPAPEAKPAPVPAK